jgi:hypothetical protein
LPTNEREEISVQALPDGSQHQTIRKRISPVSMEAPSTIRYLVQSEEYIKNLSRQLAGWVQVPNSDGAMEWQQLGKPLLNQQGRAWLISQLASVLNKSIFMSNYPENRLRPILETEFESLSTHLADHLKEYELQIQDCENVMLFVRRSIESSYRRSVGDKERNHIYGSLDESVNMQPKKDDKILGFIPKPF